MLDVAEARLRAVSVIRDDSEVFRSTGGRRAAYKAALQLRNVRGRANALRSAQSNYTFVRRADEFDQNDLLFACANGVIELETGRFRPGRREDLITVQSQIPWIPNASYELWESFLGDLFPDRPEMIRFLRRAIGYSLTGLTCEEVFFILWGNGRNGKGVLLRTIIALMGEYAVTTPFSALASQPNRCDGPRNDIAALAGRRFVSAQEGKEGCRLDEALIKSLTGGDLITARFLNKEFFTFRPTFKIWLATNHRPEIRGSDIGIWSRPKLIPFTVSFAGREDRGLKNRLLDPIQLAGVLRWVSRVA
jgi:putative DNA primase/helicase